LHLMQMIERLGGAQHYCERVWVGGPHFGKRRLGGPGAIQRCAAPR
jgi:hypothetical protein